jgi:hypothetical protein
MAGLDISTGQLTDHDSGVLPLQDTGPGITALAGQTPTAAIVPDNRTDPTSYGAVLDTTAMNLAQMAAGEADCRAAQTTGMTAENDRRAGYQAQVLPLGGHAGDQLAIPLVPDAATPPAMSDLYPWPGQEPAPASAGLAAYPNTGNEPQ